jgi:hypothetical protein
MTVFKVGDKVQRKFAFIGSFWRAEMRNYDLLPDFPLTVKGVYESSNSVVFEEIGSFWGIHRFELVAIDLDEDDDDCI